MTSTFDVEKNKNKPDDQSSLQANERQTQVSSPA